MIDRGWTVTVKLRWSGGPGIWWEVQWDLFVFGVLVSEQEELF